MELKIGIKHLLRKKYRLLKKRHVMELAEMEHVHHVTITILENIVKMKLHVIQIVVTAIKVHVLVN